MSRTTTASRPTQPKAADGKHAAAALARTNLAMVSRTTSAVVRATGDLQQEMARRAELLQKEAAVKLRHATTPVDLVALQTGLVMAGWQQSLQCAQVMTEAWFALGNAGAASGAEPESLRH